MIPTKRTTVNGTTSTDHSRRRKRNSSSNTTSIGIGSSSSTSRDRPKRIIPTTTTTTTNAGNDTTPTVLTTTRMNTTNNQSPSLPSLVPTIILPPILPPNNNNNNNKKYFYQYPPPPKKKKKKLYDLRHEIDIGNVIAYQIRHQNPPPTNVLPLTTTTNTMTNTVPLTTTTTPTTTNVTDIIKEEPIINHNHNKIHNHIHHRIDDETETDDQTMIFQQLLFASSTRCDDSLPPSGNHNNNNNNNHIVVATTTTSTTIPPKYEFHHHSSSNNNDNHHHRHHHHRIHHSSKWKRDNMDDDDHDDDIGMTQHLDTHNNYNNTTNMVVQSIESPPPEEKEEDASSLLLVVHGHHDHPKRRRRCCSTHYPQQPHPIGSRSNKSSHTTTTTTCLPFYHHSASLLSSLLWTNHCNNTTATTTTTTTPSTTFTFQQRRIVFRIVTRSILLLQPPPLPLPSVPLSSLQHHHHHVNNNMDTYRIQKNHNTTNMNPNIHSSSSLSFIPSPQQQKYIPTLWKLISYPYLYTIPTRTNHHNNGTQQLYGHHPSNSNSNSMTTTTTTLPNPTILWSTKSILLDRICRQNGIDVLELLLPSTSWSKHDHHNNLHHHHHHSNEEHHPSSTTTTTTTTTTPTTKYNHDNDYDNVNQHRTRIMTSIDLLPPSRIGLRMDTLPSLSFIPKEILSLPPNTVLIPSTTDYIPIPGTIPPTVPDINSNIENVTNTSNTRKRQRYHRSPSSPILPILFGPTDRNEHIVHTGHSIDESIYKITIASLLQQMSTTYDSTSSIYNEHHNSTTRLLLQKQLLVLVQHIVRMNQNQYYKRLLRQWKLLPVASSSSTITNNNTTTPSTTTTTTTIIPNFELPLAYFYHALMEYCSILLSGMISTKSKSSYNNNNINYNDENDTIDLDDEYDGNLNDRDPSHSDTTTNMIPIIEQVFEFLDVHITHNGVQIFPRLHLIYGIVRICKMLPESGITIIGQSFCIHKKHNNVSNNDTPIQIFRTLLEHLDEKNYLVATQSSSTNRHILNVGELEYTLYRASLIFLNNCIQREPWNIQYRCWYIGTIASSLLLCSGQQIVSTFTNRTKQKRFQPQHHSSRAQKSIVFSTIRRPLPKFQELRKQTALAFRELVQLSTTYPNHHMTHSAIASFLEWDQVMSLLLGPSMNSNRIPTKSYNTYYHHFRNLYRYHKAQWAHQENTTVAYETLRRATNNDNEVYLQELASALESDPSNIDHWHALVQALGPIGQFSSSRCDSGPTASECDDAYCQECDRLVDGITIDHDTITKRNHNTSWWGYDRSNWWFECLLQPRKCQSTENKCSTSGKRRKGRRTTDITTTNGDSTALTANFMNELKNLEIFHRRSGPAAAPSISIVDDDSIMDDTAMPVPPPLEEWFETFLSYIDDPGTKNKSTMNMKRKKTANNNHVYIPFLTWTNDGGADDTDSSSSRCDVDSINDLTNVRYRYPHVDDDDTNIHNMDTGNHADDAVNICMIGYKVLIICHLYSVSHVSVNVYVKQLYDAIILSTTTKIGDGTNTYHHRNNNDGRRHPAYYILCWLYRMGLDVTNDIYIP